MLKAKLMFFAFQVHFFQHIMNFVFDFYITGIRGWWGQPIL